MHLCKSYPIFLLFTIAPDLLIQSNISLSDHTTIGLGGPATQFAVCESLEQIQECLNYASASRLRVSIIGGGSNVIFADEGFRGLVLKLALRNIAFMEDGQSVVVTAAAGECWDQFVDSCIQHHLAGIECLSGIPGLVGATPIQNVGAYGQEVSTVLVSLKAMERETQKIVNFSGDECRFAYRQSRFKSEDADRYIITEVTFRLRKHGRPEIRYPELSKYIESRVNVNALESGRPALEAVRQAVIALRKTKSMVVDTADPNSRSVGSFFMNPVLTRDEYHLLEVRWRDGGTSDSIPTFPAGTNVKIAAAWLVEKSGFRKGFR